MPRLESIQLMRALAAMMVLIGHVIAEAEHYFGLTLAIGRLPWTRGVDIFFVISGFIIALSGRRYFGQPGGTRAFLLRRIIRVVPLYWLFTTLMLLTLMLMPSGVKEATLDPAQILTSYAFIPHARPDGRLAPILSLGWTLNYEMFFYLIFSAFLTIRWPLGLLLVLGSIAALALAGAILTPTTPLLAVWTNTILIEFAFGVILAEAWRATKTTASLPKGTLTLTLGFALLIAMNREPTLPRFIASGLPALLIVAGPVLFWQGKVAARLPRIGQLLGDSSYALYLSHRFVLRALTLALLPILPATLFGATLYIATVSLVATSAGILVFRHIETPMLATLNRRLLSAKTHPVAA